MGGTRFPRDFRKHDRVWREILASTIDHIDHIEHLLNEHSTLEVTGLG